MYSLHTVVGLIAVDPCSIACYRPFVQPIQGAHVLPFSIKQERKSPWLQRASGRLLGSQVLADALHRDRNCYEILDLLRLSVSPSTPPSKGGIFHPTIWSAAKFRETKNVMTLLQIRTWFLKRRWHEFASETKPAVDMGCHPWGCRSSTALFGFESHPNVRCCIDTFLGFGLREAFELSMYRSLPRAYLFILQLPELSPLGRSTAWLAFVGSFKNHARPCHPRIAEEHTVMTTAILGHCHETRGTKPSTDLVVGIDNLLVSSICETTDESCRQVTKVRPIGCDSDKHNSNVLPFQKLDSHD